MNPSSSPESPDLIRLRQELRESRASVAREYSGLLYDLDLQKRFTESVKRHPLGWIGGAAAAGLLATLLGGGSRKSGKKNSETSSSPTTGSVAGAAASMGGGLAKAGWIGAALEVGKLLYPILRPVVVEFVSNAARSGLAKRGRLQ
jgi:hypothetical protein